jgi:hypothetical protein
VLRQIDHVVYVGRDLDTLIAHHRSLGFVVEPGGVHADGLSHNALVGFADGSYLELFAFRDLPAAAGRHVWVPVAECGGGWADFALLSDDLAGDAVELTALVSRPAQEGGRVRPDGARIAWRSARLTAPLPFLIQDATARELRVPGGAATKHPNGVRGVTGLVLGARDVAAVRERYAALELRGAPRVEIRRAERDGLIDVRLG